MVKNLSRPETTSNPDGTKKQRKKQAKREAKVMLEIEQAKKDVQKAEQKIAKGQAQLEASRTHLRELEAQVEEMRASHKQPKVGKDTSNAPSSTASQNGAEKHAPVSPPTNQVESLPPAEGRADIAPAQEASATQNFTDTSSATQQKPSLPPAEGRTDIAPAQESAEPVAQEPTNPPELTIAGNAALPLVATDQEAADNISHSVSESEPSFAHDDAEAEAEDEQTAHKIRRSPRRRHPTSPAIEGGHEELTEDETDPEVR